MVDKKGKRMKRGICTDRLTDNGQVSRADKTLETVVVFIESKVYKLSLCTL